MVEFRCMKCNRLLARFTECQELEIKCSRCRTHNQLFCSGSQVRHIILNSAANLDPLNRPKVVPLGVSLR